MKAKQCSVSLSFALAVFILLAVSAVFAGKPAFAPSPSHLGVTPENFVTLRGFEYLEDTIRFERVFPDGTSSGEIPYTPTGGTLIITDIECIFLAAPYGGFNLEVNGQEVYFVQEEINKKFSDHLTAGIVIPEDGEIKSSVKWGGPIIFLRGYTIGSQ